MESPHYSYSQFSMYLRCGEQYYQRYIENRIIPPSIALFKGKSLHNGIELNNKQKIKTKIDLHKKIITDYTINSLEEKLKTEELFLTQEEKSIGKNKIIGKAKDRLVVMSELYTNYMAPMVQPRMAEQQIAIELPETMPIIGYIDCVDEYGNIRDAKLTGKTKNQSEANRSLQLTIYTMGYEALTGRKPNNVCLDVLVDKKNPEYKPLVSKRTENDVEKALRIIHACIEGIEKDIFLPAQEGSWACSPKFCGYYSSCKYT